MNLIEAAHYCSVSQRIEAFNFEQGSASICPKCKEALSPEPVVLFQLNSNTNDAKREFVKKLFKLT